MANDHLGQMATLLLVYGKWPLLLKMADGHITTCLWQMATYICLWQMATLLIWQIAKFLWPMATRRYVKFIYYENITYSGEERSWVLEI